MANYEWYELFDLFGILIGALVLLLLGILWGYILAFRHIFPKGHLPFRRTWGQMIDSIPKVLIPTYLDSLEGLTKLFFLMWFLCVSALVISDGVSNSLFLLSTSLFIVMLLALLWVFVLLWGFAKKVKGIYHKVASKRTYEEQIVFLNGLQNVLRNLYRQHHWLKLKKKKHNLEYVRRWHRMANLPYDADPPQKKQYNLPSYYRRRVRDFA
ncbi:MAG TPA: hypothetical protein PL066_00210 [bacterium]|nr:hypothetical protein [bacterium]